MKLTKTNSLVGCVLTHRLDFLIRYGMVLREDILRFGVFYSVSHSEQMVRQDAPYNFVFPDVKK
jgi:hypothetical protein